MKSQSKLDLNWTRNISVKPSVFFPSDENDLKKNYVRKTLYQQVIKDLLEIMP